MNGHSFSGCLVATLVILAASAGAAVCAEPTTTRGTGLPSTITNQRTITGYNAAIDIDKHPPLSSVRAGQIVEFNPASLVDPAAYMHDVAALGAVPEWYWVGPNCLKGSDCDELRKAGVPLGSTGTAEWNKTEERIYDVRHPSSLERTRAEMRRALLAAAKAGSDMLFRIDNLHNLDNDQTFDARDIRSDEALSALLQVWVDAEKALRDQGALKKSQLTGLTAHNNFGFWSRWTAAGKMRPVILRLENPSQLPQELAKGVDLMRLLKIPFIAVEFEQGLDYVPTEAQITSIAREVSLTVVMKDESQYIAGRTIEGPGPREIRP